MSGWDGDAWTPSTRLRDGGPRRPGDPARDPLVERTIETGLLRDLVDGLAEGRPAVATVEGAPGTGRTALLRTAAAFARERSVRVAVAAGSPYEKDLPFGVVSQLLSRVVRTDHPLWTDVTGSEHGAGLVSLLCKEFLSAARERPLLVVVDDSHLADAHSARWLDAMDRRLVDVGLMLLLATDPGAAPIPAVNGGRPRTGLPSRHVLVPAALGVDGVRAVLASSTAGPVHEEFARAAHRATGGNPALLRAVLGEVGSRAGTADLRAAVATAVGDRGVELVAGLPGELVTLVRVLAVCGSRLDFDLVCALAGLRTMSRDAALEVLVGAGLARGGARVELADAAVGDRVLAAMSPALRADLHARAAELGHRAGCADEDVAGLLLRADPVGAHWAMGVLRRAADRARHDGRPDEAVTYLERALREPLDDGDRVRLRVDLAVAQPASASIVGARHLSRVGRATGTGCGGVRGAGRRPAPRRGPRRTGAAPPRGGPVGRGTRPRREVP